MQVGALDASIRLVFSTISEAEHLCDYLAHCKEEGRHVNVRFQITRLPHLADFSDILDSLWRAPSALSDTSLKSIRREIGPWKY